LERHGLEKIKTIGDCYMVASGLPQERPDHAQAAAQAALEMVRELQEFNTMFHTNLQLRVGMHSGAVVAGVIGRKKFAFDLWGDTVNIASRMESHGEPDKVHCSEEMYELLREDFHFEKRGEIAVKGRGSMMTYFLLAKKEG
jgi:class 3 adenylate cyclase